MPYLYGHLQLQAAPITVARCIFLACHVYIIGFDWLSLLGTATTCYMLVIIVDSPHRSAAS